MTTQTEALKLALEALEIFATSYSDGNEAITAIKKALAQPEQEPIKLWCDTCEGTGEVYQEHQKGCHVGGHFKCPDCNGEGHIVSRLYTTPPQRTWVGLTDEEIEMIVENKRAAHWEFVRQVEAMLRNKNT